MSMRNTRHLVVTPLAIRNLITMAAMALAMLSPALGATLICRWVDENGRVQRHRRHGLSIL